MVGPRKRGQLVRRNLLAQQQQQNMDSVQSNRPKTASGSSSSDAATFVTPATSPTGQLNASTTVQPQTSESHASTENQTIVSPEDHQNDSTGMKLISNFSHAYFLYLHFWCYF